MSFDVDRSWLAEQLDPTDVDALLVYGSEDLPPPDASEHAAIDRFRHEELLPFLALLQPDDELWAFESPGFRRLRGFRGLAIVRDGAPVEGLLTSIS